MQFLVRRDVTKVKLSLCTTLTPWWYIPKHFQLRTRWKFLVTFVRRQLSNHKQLDIRLYVPQNRSEDCTTERHFIPHIELNWARYSSLYRYSFRIGRSGDRIPAKTKFSATVQTGPGAHYASRNMGTGSFFREWSGPGVALTTCPHQAPRLNKKYSQISTPLLNIHGLFVGELYLFAEKRIPILLLLSLQHQPLLYRMIYSVCSL